jgi:preprotein translocase subunit SecD
MNTLISLGHPPTKVSIGHDIAERPAVNLEFAPDVAGQLTALTAANLGRKMVVMSGDRVLASLTIRSAVGKHVQITLGDKARSGEAEELAASLREARHPPTADPSR